ncbi:uncharacterized protein LDX57_007699 [Aspergillus melleus]|uniref:uncharacterized protein n=1 Tax=Aspergillus melleus TaxID=138277 RepID=UPI001E8E31B0|nr:uncharacterized protein LDX57_007699 [Aspergillus melleus]KAH8430028.1 hypothetical protein LDX57_007699 [Aspergillus melleus]
MPSVQDPLNPINPLHHERCIASSPDGVCPGQIDFTKRNFAELELFLAKQASNPKNRAIGFRNAAKLMICGNHEDTLQEAGRVARQWEEAAQNSNPTMHSVARRQVSSYNQTSQESVSIGVMTESCTRHSTVI